MPGILRSPGNGLAVPSRIDSVVALLYMSPRKSQIKAHHELCMRMWHSLFFLTAKTQKCLWMPVVSKLDKYNEVWSYNETIHPSEKCVESCISRQHGHI